MKQSVIKELKNEELFERLEDESSSISKMKMNHSISPLENPMVLKYKRKVIARLHTEIKKRNLAAK